MLTNSILWPQRIPIPEQPNPKSFSQGRFNFYGYLNPIELALTKMNRHCLYPHCNKQLTSINSIMCKCLCNNSFCHVHRSDLGHPCSFDHHVRKKFAKQFI